MKNYKRVNIALYRSPEYQTSAKSIGLSVQGRKFEIDFQCGGCGGHLAFPIGTNLAVFDLLITRYILRNFLGKDVLCDCVSPYLCICF